MKPVTTKTSKNTRVRRAAALALSAALLAGGAAAQELKPTSSIVRNGGEDVNFLDLTAGYDRIILEGLAEKQQPVFLETVL